MLINFQAKFKYWVELKSARSKTRIAHLINPHLLTCITGQERENNMKIYPIPMVPGPVKVAREVLEAYQINYGSADMEAEFLALYNQTEANLKTILSTRNQVVIQSG